MSDIELARGSYAKSAALVTSVQSQELLILLRLNKLAVLSTVHAQNIPESALIAFAEDKDLNLYFQTRVTSRKYANLQHNKRVSCVIGWDLSELQTLQYEGIAQEIEAVSLREVKALFIQKDSPSKEEYLDHADARFFKVSPTWIRYSNYSTKPPIIWECTFS